MRTHSLLLSAFLSLTMVTSGAKAQSAWPTDPRIDISDDQLSVGLMLAGGDLYRMVSDGKCEGGTRDRWNNCQIGNYRFTANDRHSATGYLQSEVQPDTYSPVLMVNSSLIYMRAGLKPSQQRAISVDIAELVLDKKLTEIDPDNPDTFFDPRENDF